MAAHRSTAKHSSRSTNTRSRSTHATARRTVTGHAISPSSATDDLAMATATDSFDSPNLVATTGRVRANTRRSTTPRRSLTTACWPRSGRSETPRERAGRELRGQLQDRADRRPHLAYAIAARARRREVPRPTQPQPPCTRASVICRQPSSKPKRRGLRPPRGERRTGHRRPASGAPRYRQKSRCLEGRNPPNPDPRKPARLIQAASACCHREDDCGPVDAFRPVGVACSPVVAAM